MRVKTTHLDRHQPPRCDLVIKEKLFLTHQQGNRNLNNPAGSLSPERPYGTLGEDRTLNLTIISRALIPIELPERLVESLTVLHTPYHAYGYCPTKG